MFTDGTTRVLLDCGATNDSHPEFPDVDLCIVTHAHWDHVGGLVSLVEKNVPIYATAETARFISSALQPSVGSVRSCAISDIVIRKKFQQTFDIGDLRITLLPSGHMAGASMVRIESQFGTFLYTGDFSPSTRFECDVPRDVDLLLCETTLVNFKSSGEPELPTSGLVVGRAIGELPEVAARLTEQEVPFRLHQNAGGDADQSTSAVSLQNGELVLVAGRLDRDTASWKLTEPLLEDPSKSITLVNGVSRTTVGQKLLRTKRRQKTTIRGRSLRLRAHLRDLSVSLHATREEMMAWIESVSPAKTVLTHGPLRGQKEVARKLSALRLDVVVAKDGEFFDWR